MMTYIKISESRVTETYPFLDIPNTSKYKLTQAGEVVSFLKKQPKKGGRGFDWIVDKKPQRIVKQALDKDGYATVGLKLDSGHVRLKVHQLVLICNGFPKTSENPVVRHLDDNKLNNSLNNLKWGTIVENGADYARQILEIGYRNPAAKLTDEQVLIIRNSNETIKKLSNKYGLTEHAIHAAKRGYTYKNVK